MASKESELNPVTFEVLKNGFTNLVDQMGEQIIRTCYSFVMYNRDFSCALCDANGDTIMQGSKDIAIHVGTLHLTAKVIKNAFKDDINEGDVFIVNDPYTASAHFPDVRVVRPIFYQGELVAFTLSVGHWADAGGSVPGSFDVKAKEFYGEGIRITPVRLWDKGRFLADVANCLVSNMRGPRDRMGDLIAQAEGTKVGERELLRLIGKYGKDTVLQSAREVQDYVERIMRAKLSRLPDGTWESVDFIDQDPTGEEGLVPVKVKMTLKGSQIYYDLEGCYKYLDCYANCSLPVTISGLYASTKVFFPDVPFNSGFFRVIDYNIPENTVVNVPPPIACGGGGAFGFEKLQSIVLEIWSNVMPARALACTFNIEYLMIGGVDKRAGRNERFMWYDWMAGGHGARSGIDGRNATTPLFGLAFELQPCEGQERLSPAIISEHSILRDSGGPGKFRGGCGLTKGGTFLECERTVVSNCSDRARSVTFGIFGGLPAVPHGVWKNKGKENEEFLEVIFSDIPVKTGDTFTRPSSGGGGLGDPLTRDPERVLQDVIDGYVSVARAKKDYGVVINVVDEEMLHYQIDQKATKKERAYIRQNRAAWMREDPEEVKRKLLAGEIDVLDVVRRYGVIMHWGTKEILPKTTQQFREMLERRTTSYWK